MNLDKLRDYEKKVYEILLMPIVPVNRKNEKPFINSENIKVDGIKYCEYKFVNLEEFNKGIVSPVIDIDDFREIIEIILKE